MHPLTKLQKRPAFFICQWFQTGMGWTPMWSFLAHHMASHTGTQMFRMISRLRPPRDGRRLVAFC